MKLLTILILALMTLGACASDAPRSGGGGGENPPADQPEIRPDGQPR